MINIIYNMAYSTRSHTSVTTRDRAAAYSLVELRNSVPANYGTRWSKTDERELISMFRNGYSADEIANTLKRDREGVIMRGEKIVQEHVAGGVTLEEACKWLNFYEF